MLNLIGAEHIVRDITWLESKPPMRSSLDTLMEHRNFG
jgi:hypothetical protein